MPWSTETPLRFTTSVSIPAMVASLDLPSAPYVASRSFRNALTSAVDPKNRALDRQTAGTVPGVRTAHRARGRAVCELFNFKALVSGRWSGEGPMSTQQPHFTASPL